MTRIKARQVQGIDTLSYYIPKSGNTISNPASGIYSETISASTYLNLPPTAFNGGVVTGGTIFTGGVTANTISATTYYGLPTDIYTTGATYSNNTFTFGNSTGGTFNVGFSSVSGLTSTGTITSNALSATTISATTLSFDTSYTGSTPYGTISWDTNFGVPQVGMIGGNVVQKIGESVYAYVKNVDTSTLNKGEVVYIFGASGDKISVKRASSTGDTTSSKTLGVVAESIAVNGLGYIITQGTLDGLSLSSYAAGDILWLSPTPGQFTKTKQYAPNHLVFVGVVQRANSGNGQIYVKPQNGYELEELHDVMSTGATFGDLLSYSAYNGSDVWVSTKILNGSYTITGNTFVGGSITANTISSNTYYGLPTDIYTTGATYSNNTFTFGNSTGGTFNVGFSSVSGLTSIGTINTSVLSATSISATTYYGNGSNLTGISTIVQTDNVVYVSKNGNDSTGARNLLTKPFLTLDAAVTASTSGDTIVVFPGAYTATTTSTNGIAKNGVNYYFHPGATVLKTSSGDIFNNTGFSLPTNVYGQGSFNKTTSTGLIYNSSINYSEFNALDISSTVSNCIYLGGTYSKVNLRYGVTTAGRVIFVDSTYCDIKFKYLRSTSSEAMFCQSSSSYLQANGELCESTATQAIYVNGSNNSIFNISNVLGNASTGFSSYAARYIFNGNTNYFYPFSCSVTFNGYATTLKTSGVVVGGAMCQTLIVNDDYGNNARADVQMLGTSLSITQSAGVSNIKLPRSCTYLTVSSTGGVMNFDTAHLTDGYFYGTGYQFLISGGRVNLNSLNAQLVDRWEFIRISSGILDLGQSTIKLNSSATTTYSSTASRNTGIKYSGGTLISNGARIVTLNDDCLPIEVYSPNLKFKVLSGGFNTNSTIGVLSAKKQKYKLTINSVATTTIVLNDGSGGNETFTETNTAVYNTTALLAQRIAALINASGTLDITASQDNPGTDTYFYIEADTAGVPFTMSTYTNLTAVIIRVNSYSMTNSTGGMIIEDADVE